MLGCLRVLACVKVGRGRQGEAVLSCFTCFNVQSQLFLMGTQLSGRVSALGNRAGPGGSHAFLLLSLETALRKFFDAGPCQTGVSAGCDRRGHCHQEGAKGDWGWGVGETSLSHTKTVPGCSEAAQKRAGRLGQRNGRLGRQG